MKIELNQIPYLIEEGLISRSEALNYLAEFVFKNYPLFGLHKFDEDFKAEILVEFLEKGGIVLDCYNKKVGNFFPYFFSHISSLINKNLKTRAKNCLNELCTVHEEYGKIFQDRFKYEPLRPLLVANPRPPYTRKKVSPEDLQKAFKSNSSKKQKILITLLLKYVLYFDEKSIYTICAAMKLDPQILLDGIAVCKNSLKDKIKRQKELTESRNKSYYYHNRYQSQLKMMEKSENNSEKNTLDDIEQKYRHHTELWNAKNRFLSKQASHMVTPNKLIADLLGICERQVRYYLFCAKRYSKEYNLEMEEAVV